MKIKDSFKTKDEAIAYLRARGWQSSHVNFYGEAIFRHPDKDVKELRAVQHLTRSGWTIAPY